MINFEAFFKISYGLYIICSTDGEKSNGYVGNTAFQVTAEPAKFGISCSKNNLTTSLIEKGKVFSVSVLKQEAKADIIGNFGYKSGRDIDKLSTVQHFIGETGCPVVTEDCISWYEFKVVDRFDVGTHIIFIGELINSEMLDERAEPITYSYYRNIKKGKAPKNAPTYVASEKTPETPKAEKKLDIYYCPACGYEYDPANGDEDTHIAAGTAFEDIPNNWQCPVCGLDKSDFVKK